jgi:hypothetical protein
MEEATHFATKVDAEREVDFVRWTGENVKSIEYPYRKPVEDTQS